MYKFGDWVVYSNGGCDQIGRVTCMSKDGKGAFVCYHHGCTASYTSLGLLKPYDESKHIVKKDFHIGYHRFDDSCPDYDEVVCNCCNPDKGR